MSKVTVVFMLDLTKGFNTVCHEIPVHKMHLYGIRGHCFNWFKSYLSGHLQFVKFNNSFSNVQNISIVVPQGMILSSILFFLFVNDFPKCFKNRKYIIYMLMTLLFISLVINQIDNSQSKMP